MRYLALLLAVALPTSASALTSPRSGFYADAGGGFVASLPPLAGGLGWQAGLGVWGGHYDDEYALGRFNAFGVGLRQDLRGGLLHTAVVGEVRRGIDILVVGWHVFFAGGPTFVASEIGALGEVGLGAKGRFKFSGPFVGWQLRAHAGAEVGPDGPDARVMATLGIEIAAPFRPVEPPT